MDRITAQLTVIPPLGFFSLSLFLNIWNNEHESLEARRLLPGVVLQEKK